MTLKIYGTAASRAARPLWVAQELGLVYEHISLSYLAGERFTVADVCVASVLAWVETAQDLMAACPRVAEWLQRCLARPAFQQVKVMAKSG